MRYSFSERWLAQLKEQADIVTLISDYVSLKPSGSLWKGLCPFHNEKTPSFTVNQDQQFFKCFGCGEGGDMISFIMKHNNLSFQESVIHIAERFHVALPEEENIQDTEKIKRSQMIYDLLTTIAKFYYLSLTRNSHALSYVYHRMDEQSIKNFGIGFAPRGNQLIDYLLSKGYEKELLLETGNFYERNGKLNDRFFDRLIFPIFDRRRRVIGFGGRKLDNQQPKYINTSDTDVFHKKKQLYGIHLAVKSKRDKLIVVEGYMDVIALHQHGFDFAVATLGTSFAKEHCELIKKMRKKIFIAFDQDEAGRNATYRAIEIMNDHNIYPYVISIAPYKDPDEALSKEKPDFIEQSIEDAISDLQFMIEFQQKGKQLDRESDRDIFFEKVVAILQKYPNAIKVEQEIKRLSKDTGISIKSIGQMVFGKYFSMKQFSQEGTNNQEQSSSEHLPAISNDLFKKERDLLDQMQQSVMQLHYLVSQLHAMDFTDKDNRNKFISLKEKSKSLNNQLTTMGNNESDTESFERLDNMIIIFKKFKIQFDIEQNLSYMRLNKNYLSLSEREKILKKIYELTTRLQKMKD